MKSIKEMKSASAELKPESKTVNSKIDTPIANELHKITH